MSVNISEELKKFYNVDLENINLQSGDYYNNDTAVYVKDYIHVDTEFMEKFDTNNKNDGLSKLIKKFGLIKMFMHFILKIIPV